MVGFLEIVAGVFACLILAAIFWPVYASSGPGRRSPCVTNLKQLSTAMALYESDSNDHFPKRDHWMDQIKPYVKNDEVFRCPSMPAGTFGYAFNGAFSGKEIKEDLAQEILLFDSVNSIWNASDFVTSLPRPGRHKGLNSLGYADGHVKAVRMVSPEIEPKAK